MCRFIFALLLMLILVGCASVNKEEVQELEKARYGLKVAFNSHIYNHFVPELHDELMDVPVTFEHQPKFLWRDIVGFYNPILDHITMKPRIKTFHLTVHEFLHRVWFYNLTDEQVEAFRRDFVRFRKNPYGYLELEHKLERHLDSRHWANLMFAEDTEAYSEIGEVIVANAVQVPEYLRAHYRGILKSADPKQKKKVEKDCEGECYPLQFH